MGCCESASEKNEQDMRRENPKGSAMTGQDLALSVQEISCKLQRLLIVLSQDRRRILG